MLRIIQKAADHFRLGLEAEASEHLKKINEHIEKHVIEEGLPSEQFLTVLKIMCDAQQRGDYLCVADLLQYEIQPYFKDL